MQIEFDSENASVQHPRLFNEIHIHRLGEEKKNEEEIIGFSGPEHPSEPIDVLQEVMDDEEEKEEHTQLLTNDVGNIYDQLNAQKQKKLAEEEAKKKQKAAE